jgi:hypothetical protein
MEPDRVDNRRPRKSAFRSTWASAPSTSNGATVRPSHLPALIFKGKHKVWSTGETDEKAARRRATDDFIKLHRRIAQGEHLHGHLLSEAVQQFLNYADTRLTRELSAIRAHEQLGEKFFVCPACEHRGRCYRANSRPKRKDDSRKRRRVCSMP